MPKSRIPQDVLDRFYGMSEAKRRGGCHYTSRAWLRH